VLEGEAGIGKTTLWRAALKRASEVGLRVLATVATEPEARLSYAGLGDLLGLVVDDVLDELPPPQRNALQVALLLREPGAKPPDERAVAVATLAALRATGDTVLVAVDDAHWLDRSSADALSFSFRRFARADGVRMLLTRRTGMDGGLVPEPNAERVEVSSLSVGAIHRIVTQQLGSALPRPWLMRVHAASGGNPLYAVELARTELTDDGPSAHGRTPTLVELAQQRLNALPEPTREALLLVAAEPEPRVAVLSAALGADVLEILVPAFDVGLVALDGRHIRFSHPVLASAVQAEAPEHVRRRAHALLAAAATSVEERGHHLALATVEPDAEVAAAVEHAAASARGRGARAEAAELFRRAAELTPDSDEAGRGRRLVIAADCFFEAGGARQAHVLLDEAATLDGPARPEALWRLGRILDETEGFVRSREQWEEALATNDLGMVVNVRRSMALAALFVDGDMALGDAVAGVEAATRLGDPRSLALALAMEGYVRGVLGDAAYRAPLDRALELEDDSVLDELHSPSAVVADLGRLSLDLEKSRQGYEAVLRRAEEIGDARMETWCAYGLGMVEALAGNWDRAWTLAARATELSEQVTLLGLPAVRLTALVAACRGEVELSRDLLEACDTTSRHMGDRMNLLGTLAIDGFLELSVGDHAVAIAALSEAWDIQRELGIREPGVTRFLVDLAEALADVGRADEAEQAAAAFSAQADELHREWARPLVARADGEVLLARGEIDPALARLESAVAHEDLLPMPLDRARTRLVLGSAQRRARHRRAARETLEHGLEMFSELGAVLWANKARAELARIGGRTGSSGDLTPTEQRVAALVAEGMSNKEVAATLVVTVSTVESALTSIYRKLGVRSRTEMARKLPIEAAAPTD
jgi:DNA-binding CsgD family transcriptional regulator